MCITVTRDISPPHHISCILGVSPEPPQRTEAACKSNPWSEGDDSRLPAGFHKYELNSQVGIAKFDGNY
jgi:hypothetical protein